MSGPKSNACLALAILTLAGCGESREDQLRKLFATQTTGIIRLPPGTIELKRELVLAPGAHDLEISGSGTLLKADEKFEGRALIVIDGARDVRLHDFSLDGNRVVLGKPQEMAAPENALRVWYTNNGILADRVEGLAMADLHFGNVVSFAVVVSRSSKIVIRKITVEDSGSKNALGRNNLSGGILLEEGSQDFEVRDCIFRRIAGNGLWTHSLRTSPRLKDGVFAGNRFDTVGRDALQVGHATRVRVEGNSGTKIGYPVQVVDVENGGTPVAIDTAGNVDQTVYSDNSFDEINGKCMDLDGFHDGAVRGNHCLNRLRPDDYTFGQFGIVMNNTDPDAQARNIEVSGNVIDGAKFGGLFLMGTGHRITGNHFLHLNSAGCPETAKFACVYRPDEPMMLQSGIYLGRGVARMQETRGNLIRGNQIVGHHMSKACVVAGPGVSLAANTVDGNQCSDEIEIK